MVDFTSRLMHCMTVQSALVLLQVCMLSAEMILGVENDEFDFDGLPGAQHEFKVHIPPNTEDCFFQPVDEGASLHVNMEVLIGGDKNVNFNIRDHNWMTIDTKNHNNQHMFNLERAPVKGTYALCIDNMYKYESRLVYVFLVTYKMAEWTEFQVELQNLNLITANFTTSLTAVQESITAAKQSQVMSRMNVVRDYYLLMNNNHYVFVWSCAQCVLVVVAAGVQTYSLRRLFRNTNVQTAKPRA